MTADPDNPARAGDAEESTPPPRAVVVGVDGSTSSDAAARWAADEAARRNLPLRVVHAVPPITPGAFPAALATAAIDWKARADALLGLATRPLRDLHPQLAIEALGVVGQPPAVALTDDAQDAQLLVVGSRGGGGFVDLLLGSTAIQVLERATMPVVIVRPPHLDGGLASANGPVVVGVDGSDASRRALHFAFTEAALRKTTLTAVHAWAITDHPGIASLRASGVVDGSLLARQAADVLGKSLAAVLDDFPDVEITEHAVDERPVPALLAASRGAQLLVVGSRGRGAFAGLVLGSVSHSTARGAACPVAVIR